MPDAGTWSGSKRERNPARRCPDTVGVLQEPDVVKIRGSKAAPAEGDHAVGSRIVDGRVGPARRRRRARRGERDPLTQELQSVRSGRAAGIRSGLNGGCSSRRTKHIIATTGATI